MRTIRARRAVAVTAVSLLLAGCGTGGRDDSIARPVTRLAVPGTALPGTGSLPTPPTPWPAASYDARHSSGTTATGPQRGTIRWRRHLDGGSATPGPVIGVDGSILAATNAGVLHALDPRTGRDRWRFDGAGAYGSDLSTSPAVLADGTILWPGPHDTLFALRSDGTVLWREAFDGQVLSPAVAGRDRVYVADMTGRLDAFEITGGTHRRVWRVDAAGVNYASPTVGPEGNVYLAADDDLVAVRDLGDRGAVRWRLHLRTMVEVSNAVAPDGTVLLGTNNDRQFGVTPDGTVRWAVDIGDYSYSSSVVRPDGTGFFGDNMGVLHVLDTGTGAVRATIAPRGRGVEKIWTAPAVDAEGSVYWASTDGRVYGYTAQAKRLFAVEAGSGSDSYPALGADRTLYVGTTDGTVVAIG